MTKVEALAKLHELQAHFAPGSTLNAAYWLLDAVIAGNVLGMHEAAERNAERGLEQLYRERDRRAARVLEQVEG